MASNAPDRLVAALLAEFSSAPPAPPDAGGRVSAFLERARTSRPEVSDVSAEALVSAVRGAKAGAVEDLASLDAGEIWLAAGCCDGRSDAVEAFDELYVAPLAPALRSMGLRPDAVEELQQRLRSRLLTAAHGSGIRLLDYAGKGRLQGLVRVAAVRTVIDDRRKAGRAPKRLSLEERTIERVMEGELGPELQLVEREHGEAVKAAFGAAIQSLDPRSRGILRLHLLERATIDEIAALHEVHRATAARWIAAIRGELAEQTHRLLQTRLALDPAGLKSLLRAVDSRLDLSLSRRLAATGTEWSDSQE